VVHLDIDDAELAAFCARHRIRRLAVFGSALRDDFGPGSDVDVLAELDPEARVGFLALARARRELAELLGRPVDLVPGAASLKPLIRDAVLSEAEVVFAA
jgi:predicted nucleotidyltransferase